jgi:hypothetical protein
MQAVDPTSSPYLKIVLVFILLALVVFLGVRKLASQYLVDTGFSGAMSIGADGEGGAQASENEEVCATCGHSGPRRCSGCKRVRYWYITPDLFDVFFFSKKKKKLGLFLVLFVKVLLIVCTVSMICVLGMLRCILDAHEISSA